MKILFTLLLALPFFGFSQGTTTVDFINGPLGGTNTCGDMSICRLGLTGRTVTGVMVKQTHGCPGFGSGGLVMSGFFSQTDGHPIGSGMAIEYNFKPDYLYTITIDGGLDNAAGILQMKMTNTLTYDDNVCTIDGAPFDFTGTSDPYVVLPYSSFVNYQKVVTMTPRNCFSYLWFTFFPVSGDGGAARISKVTIQESPMFAITGLSNFCTSTTYTVSDVVTPGNVVNWQVVQSGSIVSSSVSGNSITLTKIADGTIQLNASITNAACGVSRNLSRTIDVGAVYTTGTYRVNYGADINWSGSQVNLVPLSPSQSVSFIVHPNFTPNTVSYSWTPASSPVASYYTSGEYLYFNLGAGQPSQQQFLLYTDQGACGTMNRYVMFILTGYGYRMVETPAPEEIKEQALARQFFTLSPNPAGNNVQISVSKSRSSVTGAKKTTVLNEVKVYDLQGKLVKQVNNKAATTIKLSTADLPPGIYVVEMTSEGYKEKQKLVIYR